MPKVYGGERARKKRRREEKRRRGLGREGRELFFAETNQRQSCSRVLRALDLSPLSPLFLLVLNCVYQINVNFHLFLVIV